MTTLLNGEPRLRRTLRVWICTAVIASQLSACTKSPDSVEARYVSPNMYNNWTCEQLVEERIRLSREVARVSGLQRENANADAAMMTVGVILLWPMLFGLAATTDRKDELGRLKGEYEAVDYSMKSKQCTMPAPGQPSMPMSASPETAAAMAAAAGTYKGKGKADAWCQTPTLQLTLTGNRFEGQMSEVADGKPTSEVTGILGINGIADLEFKTKDSDKYFSGKVDGTMKGNTLSVSMRSRAKGNCSYQFELQKN